ncbi:hypothetical protein MSAN_00861500 [Mycena sanguinolenta]|uniref:Uncharacterized protein n=1 Tax=Mycena sanguinolenta TaxID=230812 RepID=A0A8H7DDD0_9AGAR|nr:hypothetical protein MSAN_00861500 [Mycena sanguinolenta]
MPRMHPSLSVANIAKLPPNIKTLAAAAASGSQKDTSSLIEKLPTVAPEHLPFLLPAFCSPLDSTRIDVVLSRFDSSGWESVKPDIVQVHSCMGGIGHLSTYNAIPTGAFVDLWQILWPWIRFLDEYEESLSGDKCLSSRSRYWRFLSLIRLMGRDEAAQELIDSTKGRWVVVGRG